MGELLDAAIAVNIIVDMIDRFRAAGVEVTTENIDQVIAEREAEKADLLKDLET